MALALLLVALLQQWPEGLPIHDAVQSRQRITQLLQFRQPVLLIKEARLRGRALSLSARCSQLTRIGVFFEVSNGFGNRIHAP